MTDETHEDLTLLAEWELRRDLQNHVAAERERVSREFDKWKLGEPERLRAGVGLPRKEKP